MPYCSTVVSPAELQMSRKFRTRWDLLKVHVKGRVLQKQEDQKRFFRGNRSIDFEPKEVAMAKDYSNNNWRKTEVVKQLGPVTYTVRTEDGRLWKRHSDQLKPCNLENNKNHCDTPTKPKQNRL